MGKKKIVEKQIVEEKNNLVFFFFYIKNSGNGNSGIKIIFSGEKKKYCYDGR